MSLRIDHAVVAGVFSLDGESFDVENNIWVIGDERECAVIDAPHDVRAIRALVGDRTLRAILCTHAHDDHVRVAPALRAETGARVLLHAAERPLWALVHPDEAWDEDLLDGARISVAGVEIEVLHTPGHAPGAVCFHVAEMSCIFTGDTLFEGGPGATGRSYSDAEQLVASIRAKLFVLPDATVVHTGHGPSTTIGVERLRVAESQFGPANARRRLPAKEVVL